MKRLKRGRSLFRSIFNATVPILLIVLVLGSLWRGGWFPTEAGRFTAIDGDSLRKGKDEYRLHAIDAPELRQDCETANGESYPCGRRALEALRRLLSEGELSCRLLETDRYGRSVSVCTLGTKDIADEMVRMGWAVAYRQHGRDYVAAEEDASSQRRGMWQGPFENPHDWRSARRKAIVQGSMAEVVEPD